MAEEQKEEIQKNNGEEIEEIKEIKLEETDEFLKCQKEKDEYLDGWKRAKADLANYKKDEAKRFESVVKFANESMIRDLILVLDSFDLALASMGRPQTNVEFTQTDAEKIPRDSALSQRDSAPYGKGLYLIRQQLEDILKLNGLERVMISVGQPFDPALQEAVVEVESDKASGTIIEEIERGYLLNGKLIRPARVKIAK